MRNFLVVITKCKFVLPLIISFSIPPVAPAQIDRVYLYDAGGNELIYTVFNYTGNINTGRTIHDPRGVLLQQVSYTDSAATRISEDYTGGNNDLQYSSTFSSQGSNKIHTLNDRFNAPLFSSTYNTEPGDNEYLVNESGGSLMHRMVYVYRQSGEVDRVNIYNDKGVLGNIAIVRYQGETSVEAGSITAPVFFSIKRRPGKIILGISLDSKNTLKTDVYNIRGSLQGRLKDQVLGKGTSHVELDVGNTSLTAGLLILKIYFEGSSTYMAQKVVK